MPVFHTAHPDQNLLPRHVPTMKNHGLKELYYRHLEKHGCDDDPAQKALVARLQRLLDELAGHNNRGGAFTKWLSRKLTGSVPSPIRGIYVWGGVGRGKTFLLNLFFLNLPIARKRRVHFHQFMREVHALLAGIHNTKAPLRKVARHFAADCRLLYLDEFHVIDIGDAMILAELLRRLTENGVVLAMTSNYAPTQLYAGGLQRQRFLPAISLIEKQLDVVELDARRDYRLQLMKRADLYLTPVNAASERVLENSFRRLATDTPRHDARLRVNGRDILARRHSGGVAWFDFDAICGGPRAAGDYLEIAHCHETVMVSGVPVFEDNDDTARRFINMIDTFYDCNVRLIVSADSAPEHLYRSGRLAGEFRRTASRLVEMQSPDYITGAHGRVREEISTRHPG